MFQHETKIRVTYADTDQMGYVYYGNYARFYEIARAESIRSLGLTYRELEKSGVMMPVLENHSKYIAPARYDELLTVRTIIAQKPAVKIKFNYEIENEEQKIIHTGETLLAFIDIETGRPKRMPENLEAVLGQFYS
ncbi:acyl-CoA thioesterase [Fulvivirga lutea]|uniref:Acyl-CoA thioesterase n=1 Tax=Fulvivirga lutea TaxID=2810512 RepID=A0A974WII9_9BACT|nr:thioesterase family protein [Fulvivirga lutea]QSE97852.1 acyl-CoA thioesterase [Fulvivirga lutea]